MIKLSRASVTPIKKDMLKKSVPAPTKSRVKEEQIPWLGSTITKSKLQKALNKM